MKKKILIAIVFLFGFVTIVFGNQLKSVAANPSGSVGGLAPNGAKITLISKTQPKPKFTVVKAPVAKTPTATPAVVKNQTGDLNLSFAPDPALTAAIKDHNLTVSIGDQVASPQQNNSFSFKQLPANELLPAVGYIDGHPFPLFDTLPDSTMVIDPGNKNVLNSKNINTKAIADIVANSPKKLSATGDKNSVIIKFTGGENVEKDFGIYLNKEFCARAELYINKQRSFNVSDKCSELINKYKNKPVKISVTTDYPNKILESNFHGAGEYTFNISDGFDVINQEIVGPSSDVVILDMSINDKNDIIATIYPYVSLFELNGNNATLINFNKDNPYFFLIEKNKKYRLDINAIGYQPKSIIYNNVTKDIYDSIFLEPNKDVGYVTFRCPNEANNICSILPTSLMISVKDQNNNYIITVVRGEKILLPVGQYNILATNPLVEDLSLKIKINSGREIKQDLNLIARNGKGWLHIEKPRLMEGGVGFFIAKEDILQKLAKSSGNIKLDNQPLVDIDSLVSPGAHEITIEDLKDQPGKIIGSKKFNVPAGLVTSIDISDLLFKRLTSCFPNYQASRVNICFITSDKNSINNPNIQTMATIIANNAKNLIGKYSFTPNNLYFVLNDVSDYKNAFADFETNGIIIEQALFEAYGSSNIDLSATIIHEYGHLWQKPLFLYEQNWNNFSEAFSDDSYSYRIPDENNKTHPLINLKRESGFFATIYGDINNRNGHPNDNPLESFASNFSVFNIFEFQRQFLEKAKAQVGFGNSEEYFYAFDIKWWKYVAGAQAPKSPLPNIEDPFPCGDIFKNNKVWSVDEIKNGKFLECSSATISGKFTNPEGKSVSDITIEATAGDTPKTTKTDSSGNYIIKDAPVGNTIIRANYTDGEIHCPSPTFFARPLSQEISLKTKAGEDYPHQDFTARCPYYSNDNYAPPVQATTTTRPSPTTPQPTVAPTTQPTSTQVTAPRPCYEPNPPSWCPKH